MKSCARCKSIKPIDAFGRCAKARDGLTYSCRDCKKEYETAWALAHPECKKQYHENYVAKHSDRYQAQVTEFNKKRAEKKRVWSQTDIQRAKSAIRRTQHAEEHAEYVRLWYIEHAAEVKQRVRDWVKQNPDRRLAHGHKRRTLERAGPSFRGWEWKALCESANFSCLACGARTKLTADHVLPLCKGGAGTIDNIQPLCGPCNGHKGSRMIDYRKSSP